MLDITRRVALAGGVLLAATQALAQPTQPLILIADRPLVWDVAGGTGLHAWKLENGRWDGLPEVRFDVGRYWTTHLKSELGVSLPRRFSDTPCAETISVTGAPFGYCVAETIRAHSVTGLSPSLTYQFRENVFAHPYVSAGARINVEQLHSRRKGPETFDVVTYPRGVRTVTPVTSTVPALDRRTISVAASPFVAAGLKSYFNERSFVRTEGLVAFNAGGVDQTSFRIAFGFDF